VVFDTEENATAAMAAIVANRPDVPTVVDRGIYEVMGQA